MIHPEEGNWGDDDVAVASSLDEKKNVDISFVKNHLDVVYEELDLIIQQVDLLVDDDEEARRNFHARIYDSVSKYWSCAANGAQAGMHEHFMTIRASNSALMNNRNRAGGTYRRMETKRFFMYWEKKIKEAGFDPLDTRTRRRACKGLSFLLYPHTKSIAIRDRTTIADSLLQKKWFSFLYNLDKKLFFAVAPFYIISLPIAFMATTGADSILFPGAANATNASAAAAYVPPWSEPVSDIAVFLMIAGSILGTFFLGTALLNLNKDMLRVVYNTMRVRIISILGINAAYTLLAIMSWPYSGALVMYLVQRFVLLTYNCLADADVARMKLRMHRKYFICLVVSPLAVMLTPNKSFAFLFESCGEYCANTIEQQKNSEYNSGVMGGSGAPNG